MVYQFLSHFSDSIPVTLQPTLSYIIATGLCCYTLKPYSYIHTWFNSQTQVEVDRKDG